ncbi:hypothetical protein BDZ45DRAFT_449613 [Acephala macrosclerotiorum]|nr:hypothetical protein BDZ45DRAFT_449613 [Acephala macrosclerotiorum]
MDLNVLRTVRHPAKVSRNGFQRSKNFEMDGTSPNNNLPLLQLRRSLNCPFSILSEALRRGCFRSGLGALNSKSDESKTTTSNKMNEWPHTRFSSTFSFALAMPSFPLLPSLPLQEENGQSSDANRGNENESSSHRRILNSAFSHNLALGEHSKSILFIKSRTNDSQLTISPLSFTK